MFDKYEELKNYLLTHYKNPTFNSLKPMLSKEDKKDMVRVACFSLEEGDVKEFIEKSMDKTFKEFLFEMVKKKNMTDAEVYNRANLDRKLYNKIINLKNYHPSKDTVLALCIGLKTNYDEAVDLLKKAGYSFQNSVIKDLVFTFFIEREIYDIITINEAIYDIQQEKII